MWWPFAKKAEPKERGPSQWELDKARIAALRAWRTVGQEFEYLGRRMVVAKHYSVDFTPGLHFPSMRLVPEVHARYADDRGEVHTLVLSEAEVLALAHSLQPNVLSPRVMPQSAARCSLTWSPKQALSALADWLGEVHTEFSYSFIFR